MNIKNMFTVMANSLMVVFLVTAQTQAASKTVFYHHDALGSIVASTDENGEVLWKEEYQPYGQKIKDTGNGDTVENQDWYTGKNYDKELDISYFGARWYDAKQGRFLSIDPVGVDPTNIHSFNRYAYANNNPYKYVDPDGRLPILIPVVIFVAKELAGEAFEQTTGIPAPTVKNLGKYAIKKAPKSGRKVDLKKTGSYTNTHASGTTYSGKGSRLRSQQSGRRQARQNDDPHVATDFTSARSTREAFKQESRRIDANGGVKSPSNYNKVESPGRRYRQQDGG